MAVGTGASQVVASSVSSAIGHWQRGNIDLQMGYLLIGGGFVRRAERRQDPPPPEAARGQLELFVTLTYVILLGVIGSLMLIESLRTLQRRAGAGGARRAAAASTRGSRACRSSCAFADSKLYISAIPPVAIGAFVGWLTAIMGVGGGFVMVPAMIYLLRMPTRMVIGTSTFQIVCRDRLHHGAAVGAEPRRRRGAGHAADRRRRGRRAVRGGLRASGCRAEQLRAGLALLVLAVAVRMAVGLVVPPSDLYAIEAPALE